MRRPRSQGRLATRLLLFVLAISFVAQAEAQSGGIRVFDEEPPTVVAGPLSYRIVATNPRLNRRVMGPVTAWVDGVPAEPVDSFCWNGEGSVPIDGTFVMVVNVENEAGFVQAEWTDRNGEWVYQQQEFIHPEHLSGVRIGRSRDEVQTEINYGVINNVYLHGDTAAGMPVLPTLFTHVAAWGPALVARNGELFLNPYELPAPAWQGHVMVSEGARDEDGRVLAVDGTVYDPSKGNYGAVDPRDLEVHLVFHDERFPRVDNIPPIFSFFYHLVFEEVRIEIIQADAVD